MDPTVGHQLITDTVNNYTSVFAGYSSQFLIWGKDLFYSFFSISIVWFSLWRAFDKNSFQESMPDFLKEFFIVGLFYAIMINAGPWFSTIVSSIGLMGETLTHSKVDPSTIISQGLKLANKLFESAGKGNILTGLLPDLVALIAFVIVFFSFCSVALDLAVTLILTTVLISLSGLLLAFSAFPFTRSVARKTLDAVIANNVKILCIYIVVASSASAFDNMAKQVPEHFTLAQSFDIYAWIVGTAVLFWLIAKNIPTQVAKIVSDTVQENRGTDAAGLAMAALRYAETAASAAAPIVGAAAAGAQGLAKIAAGALNNAAANFSSAHASGSGVAASFGNAVTQTAKDVGGALGNSITDQFKKLAGAAGSDSSSPAGIAARLHANAQATRTATGAMAGGGGQMENVSAPGLKSTPDGLVPLSSAEQSSSATSSTNNSDMGTQTNQSIASPSMPSTESP